MILKQKKKIALVYDVDYTLIDGYHPTLILEKYGINVEDFWKKVSRLQKIEKDRREITSVDIIYLAVFMNEIRHGKLKGLTLKEIKEIGKELRKLFYPGLPEFFEKIKKANPDIKISHNIVSVGIKPLLEGSALRDYVDHIFGYTFFDDLTPGDEIDEIKSTSSAQEKIPSVIAISYGNENFESGGGFEYPIKDMIYFGDGETDRGVFRFISKRDGFSICVYNPDKSGAKEKAENFERRVSCAVPADFRKNSELWNIVMKRIDEIRKS